MAAHLRDDMLYGRDHTDTHASDNRWRHQESSSFARHASAAPRGADERHGSKDLADFFNSSRIEPPKSAGSAASEKYEPIMVAGSAYDGTAVQESYSGLEVKCGPLLNYRRMEDETWFGSVLIVTRGGGLVGESTSGAVPELYLKIVGGTQTTGLGSRQELLSENGTNANAANGGKHERYGVVNGVDYTNSQDLTSKPQLPINGTQTNGTSNEASGAIEVKVRGTKLYSNPSNTFWRFDLQVPMQRTEIRCDYEIPGLSFPQQKKDKHSFFVPAISESMRIMFHCTWNPPSLP
jgi:hypothetical protein